MRIEKIIALWRISSQRILDTDPKSPSLRKILLLGWKYRYVHFHEEGVGYDRKRIRAQIDEEDYKWLTQESTMAICQHLARAFSLLSGKMQTAIEDVLGIKPPVKTPESW